MQDLQDDAKKGLAEISSQNDADFKNQKIVAVLLNRNKEMQSNERQLFFQSLNQDLKRESNFYSLH